MLDKAKFLEKYQNVPVIEYKNNTSHNPLVSVLVQTYQQVNYIGQCLEGILMQETDFDIEILVGEDDSSDGTRDICIQYANKFPDKIKLFLHSRANNIKVYGNATGIFNFKYNAYHAQGKYIAICEGDDYWTDPLKLQKQVDFLENNSDYGMVYSDISLIDFSGNKIPATTTYENIKTKYKSGEIFWNILEKNFINTLTVCTKKELILDYLNNFQLEDFSYDLRWWLHIASKSKIKYFDEKFAAYRVHPDGISRSTGFFDKRKPLVKLSALINYLSIVKYDLKRIELNVFFKAVYNILKNKNLTKTEKKPLKIMFKDHPKLFIHFLIWQLKTFITKIFHK